MSEFFYTLGSMGLILASIVLIMMAGFVICHNVKEFGSSPAIKTLYLTILSLLVFELEKWLLSGLPVEAPFVFLGIPISLCIANFFTRAIFSLVAIFGIVARRKKQNDTKAPEYMGEFRYGPDKTGGIVLIYRKKPFQLINSVVRRADGSLKRHEHYDEYWKEEERI